LLAALDRVRPEILVCGHIHGGHGYDKHDRTHIFHCSYVDELYRPVNPVTVFEL
jgi:Icc-related predicted phosphoesterase